MSRPRKTDATLAHINPNAIIAKGFEEGYIGFVRRANKPSIALYDYYTCVEVLVRDEQFSRKQAIDFMEEYILQHDGGESTPGFALWKDEYDSGEN